MRATRTRRLCTHLCHEVADCAFHRLCAVRVPVAGTSQTRRAMPQVPDAAPHMRVIPQPPQFTCAIWLAVPRKRVSTRALAYACARCPTRAHAPCMARLTVLHTEHCTLDAPLMYISSVLQPPHSSCAISVPAGGTGVMLLHSAQRTFAAPCEASVSANRGCSRAHCVLAKTQTRLRVEEQRATPRADDLALALRRRC